MMKAHPTQKLRSLLVFVALLGCVACGSPDRPRIAPTASPSSGCEEGDISYYAASLAGNPTASGPPYDHEALTAAHPKLKFGTKVMVTVDDKSILLTVNDRGPYAKGRILDVSGRAARELDLMQRGHARATVCVQ